MMRNDRLNFGLIFRTAISLLPIFFGMPTLAIIICACNAAHLFILCGPLNFVVNSLCTVLISMFYYGETMQGGELQGLFVGIEVVICAAACVYAVMVKHKFFHGVYLSAVGFLTLSYINLNHLAFKEGQSVAEYLTLLPLNPVKQQIDAISVQSGIDSNMISKAIKIISDIAVIMIPSVLIVTSIVIGYIIMWAVCRPLRNTNLRINHSFSKIRIPKFTAIIFVLSIFFWVICFTNKYSYIFANICIVMSALYFFSGMSFVDYLLRKAIRCIPIRLIIYLCMYISSSAIAFISPYINLFSIFVLIGILDLFINFRRFFPENEIISVKDFSENEGEINETKE